MVKEVNMENERKIRYFDNEDELSPNKQITESFSIDGLECAHYSLIKGETFTFSARLELDLEVEENKNSLIFEIDVDHPLYFPFLHLLNDEKEFVIKAKKDEDMKYLSIKNEEDLIILNFVDKTKNERLSNKFVINCDNEFDYNLDKDTIKQNDYLNRLNYFFTEAGNTLMEDYHQISFEEYSLKKTIDEKLRKSS